MHWINLIILYWVRILQYRPDATRTSEGSGTMCLCEIINSRNVSDAPTVKFCCCHRTLLSSIEKWKELYPPIQSILTVAFLQFLTSPFLPARCFHLFSHQLKFFWGGPLRTPGHLPRLPHPLGGPDRILSPVKTEWRLILATLCGWRRCFVADQLWLMKRIREEEEASYCLSTPAHCIEALHVPVSVRMRGSCIR